MSLYVPLIVLVCATLLSSHRALAQVLQQGPKLVVGTLSKVAFENRFSPITTVHEAIDRRECRR